MNFIKNNIRIISVLAVILVIAIIFIISSSNDEVINNESLISTDQVLKTENYDVEVLDYYQADYFYDEASIFDMYLGVELEVTNTSSEPQKFSAMTNLRLEDSSGELHQPLIDENYKIFGADLEPGDSFYLPVSFAVDESDEYALYFNNSLKEEDSKQQGFILDGSNLLVKEVPLTLEHELERRESDDKENDE